jgi:sensor domain CHASE-containing protein
VDVLSLVVGAVIGAFVSVPITVFIEDPLREFIRRVRVTVKRSSSGRDAELENHAAQEIRTIEELQAELELRKKRLERTRNLIDASRSPPEGIE